MVLVLPLCLMIWLLCRFVSLNQPVDGQSYQLFLILACA